MSNVTYKKEVTALPVIEVAVIKDAAPGYSSDVEMHAALDVNIPNYASAIVTADEIVDSISRLTTEGIGVGN